MKISVGFVAALHRCLDRRGAVYDIAISRYKFLMTLRSFCLISEPIRPTWFGFPLYIAFFYGVPSFKRQRELQNRLGSVLRRMVSMELTRFLTFTLCFQACSIFEWSCHLPETPQTATRKGCRAHETVKPRLKWHPKLDYLEGALLICMLCILMFVCLALHLNRRVSFNIST